MDALMLPDWNTDVGVEFPVNPTQRKPFGLDNELVELLWQNGEVVLQSQTHRKPNSDSTKSKQVHKQYEQSATHTNFHNLNQDDETVSWINCPVDESFEKEFSAHLLSEIPTSSPGETNKLPRHSEGEKDFTSGASNVNHVFSNSQPPDFAPIPLPPPRFETLDARIKKNGNLECPAKRQGFGNKVHECSAMTVGSSHCASNQVSNETDMSYAGSGVGSRTFEEHYALKESESMERDTLEQALTSSSGGSGSSFWKTSNQSNETSRLKRKKQDMEESQCQSDATELESAAGNKSSQKPGMSRRSRVAEVHNLSERRRRDRINEKMKVLQELIPHSNKTDKASMLDEAIEYMKSLQLQLQLMWMGRGMAPMMMPGMQQYMSRIGMGMSVPTLPAIQNIMRLSRLPLVDQALATAPMANQAAIGQSPMLNPLNYQNQIQNSRLPQQYANYMGFHSMQNTSQPINMFNFNSHSVQPNHVLPPPSNGNGATRLPA